MFKVEQHVLVLARGDAAVRQQGRGEEAACFPHALAESHLQNTGQSAARKSSWDTAAVQFPTTRFTNPFTPKFKKYILPTFLKRDV